MKQLTVGILVLLLSGCTIREHTLNLYTLHPKIETNAIQAHQYRSRTIKVAYPKSINDTMSTRIYYSRDDLKQHSYLYSQWAQVLNRIVMGQLVAMLDQSHLYRTVIDYSSYASSDYILESFLYAFEHKITPEGSFAYIDMRFNLLSGVTGKLIKSKKFTYQTLTQTEDAKGFVEASNRTMEQLNGELLQWLAQ